MAAVGGDWSDYLPSSDTIITAAAVLGAIVTIWVTSRKIASAIHRRLDPIIDQCRQALIVINGRGAIHLPENPSIEVAPPVKGALQRLESIEQGQGAVVIHIGAMQRNIEHVIGEVHEVKKEVTFNSGTSLKDAARRTEEAVAELKEHLNQIDARLDAGNARFGEIEEVLDTQREADIAMWSAIEAVAKSEPPREPNSSYADGEEETP